jgi:hypothetical protein
MEYRYAERSQVNERVELWSGKEKYGEYESENMCSGGIFVKKCQNKIDSLNPKSLTVKFCRNPNISYQASHDVVVVHKTTEGVGFKWIHR